MPKTIRKRTDEPDDYYNNNIICANRRKILEEKKKFPYRMTIVREFYENFTRMLRDDRAGTPTECEYPRKTRFRGKRKKNYFESYSYIYLHEDYLLE